MLLKNKKKIWSYFLSGNSPAGVTLSQRDDCLVSSWLHRFRRSQSGEVGSYFENISEQNYRNFPDQRSSNPSRIQNSAPGLPLAVAIVLKLRVTRAEDILAGVPVNPRGPGM
jgi:hypothetical protein